MASELDQYLNTSEGMTQIATMQDDGTVTCVGAPWFKYNGVVCDNVYISGNSWVGFGISAEQMKIDRRDAKCHYLYRQELLYNMWQCIKFRWEGYSVYNSTSESYRLVWELFLFETGDLFINAVKIPGNGTNAFDTLGGVGIFNPTTGAMISGYCGDQENGKSFTLINDLYYHTPFATLKYIIEQSDGYYTVNEEQLTKLDVINLSSDVFMTYGMGSLPNGAIAKRLGHFKIHRWQDVAEAKTPKMTASIKAVPKPQTVIQNYDIDFSHESIKSIASIILHSVVPVSAIMKIAISMDNGTTWKVFGGTAWNDVDITDKECFLQNGMSKETLESISNEQWIAFMNEQNSLKYRFAVILDANSLDTLSLSDIVVNYKNT